MRSLEPRTRIHGVACHTLALEKLAQLQLRTRRERLGKKRENWAGTSAFVDENTALVVVGAGVKGGIRRAHGEDSRQAW